MTDVWDRVAVGEPDECWLWTGPTNSDGYGVTRYEGRRMGAHRAAYLDAVGPIGEGLVLLHSCDVRLCCNPAHLTPGTHRDNMRDMRDKHRGRGQRRRPVGRKYW